MAEDEVYSGTDVDPGRPGPQLSTESEWEEAALKYMNIGQRSESRKGTAVIGSPFERQDRFDDAMGHILGAMLKNDVKHSKGLDKLGAEMSAITFQVAGALNTMVKSTGIRRGVYEACNIFIDALQGNSPNMPFDAQIISSFVTSFFGMADEPAEFTGKDDNATLGSKIMERVGFWPAVERNLSPGEIFTSGVKENMGGDKAGAFGKFKKQNPEKAEKFEAIMDNYGLQIYSQLQNQFPDLNSSQHKMLLNNIGAQIAAAIRHNGGLERDGTMESKALGKKIDVTNHRHMADFLNYQLSPAVEITAPQHIGKKAADIHESSGNEPAKPDVRDIFSDAGMSPEVFLSMVYPDKNYAITDQGLEIEDADGSNQQIIKAEDMPELINENLPAALLALSDMPADIFFGLMYPGKEVVIEGNEITIDGEEISVAEMAEQLHSEKSLIADQAKEMVENVAELDVLLANPEIIDLEIGDLEAALDNATISADGTQINNKPAAEFLRKNPALAIKLSDLLAEAGAEKIVEAGKADPDHAEFKGIDLLNPKAKDKISEEIRRNPQILNKVVSMLKNGSNELWLEQEGQPDFSSLGEESLDLEDIRELGRRIRGEGENSKNPPFSDNGYSKGRNGKGRH